MTHRKIIVLFSLLVAVVLLGGCALRERWAQKSALPEPAGTPSTETSEPAAIKEETTEPPAVNEETTAPTAPATGDVDETLKALLQDSTNETTVSQSETADTTLIDSDSQAISDFGQSYGEDKL